MMFYDSDTKQVRNSYEYSRDSAGFGLSFHDTVPNSRRCAITYGFGAQLISPIQLHVKRQNSSICKFFQDIAWTFFLPVSGKICHPPIKKVKRQPIMIISFSQHSPFFGEQSKNTGRNPTGVIRYLGSAPGSL